MQGSRDLVLCAALAGVAVLFHLLTSGGYGYFRDELYYLACARHLDFGYVDHPPVIALLVRAQRALLGDSLPAIRLLPALAAGALVFLAGAMARELGGGTLAVVTAGVGVMLAPLFVGLFGILTVNAPDAVCWALATFLLVRLLRTGEARLWLPFGLVVGVGLETKHSMLFFVFGVAVGLLLTPSRRYLASPWLWLGAAAALVLFLPNLVWEVRHGWPTLEFMEHARRGKNLVRGPLAYVGEQILVFNPLAAPVWVAGLVFLLAAGAGRPYRALGWAYLAILALMIAAGGKSYYMAAIYAPLFASGGVVLERLPRVLGWLAPAFLLATDLLMAPLAKPILPVDRLIAYQHALGQDAHAGADERFALGPLPQHFADMFGWPELAAEVARVAETLAPADRARACVFGSNYGESSAIEFFGPALGLPRAIGGHNSYWLWGPQGCDLDVVIAIGNSVDELRPHYGEVLERRAFACTYCMPYENGAPITVLRGRTTPMERLWPQLAHYE